jgi:uncharacterized membrane protein YhaH (DUF805 family)
MSSVNPYEAPQASLQRQNISENFDKTSPFSAAGRFGRAAYITYAVGSYLVLTLILALMSASQALLGKAAPTVVGTVAIIAYVLFVAFAIIFMIRRLHDLNWSGWLSILSIVPIVNLIMAIPCLFFRGTDGPNNYGPPPKTNKTHIRLATVFSILMVVALIGVLAAIAIPAYQQYTHKAQQMSQQMQ